MPDVDFAVTSRTNDSIYLVCLLYCDTIQDQDQYSHLLDSQYMPYKGHNSFRDKYFSGVTKRIAKEEDDNQK